MANGAAFEHAVELAGRNPSLDVGCHLVLVGGESVLQPRRRLPADVPALMVAVVRGAPIEEELEAQMARIRSAGIQPTHLDTHKHTHILPPVLTAVARIGRRYAIPWV